MFVPRTDAELDGCPSDRISCVPSSAILETTDTASARGTDDDDTASYDPNYMLRPGVHRYIGIIMVSVLAVLAILLWVYVARYRKSATPRDFWCCTGKRKPAKPGPFEREEEEGASTAASSTETLSGMKEGHGGEQRVSRQGGGVSEKDGHADARGVIKEVSGGVVMFTQAPKAAWRGARDRESHHHYSPRSHRSHGHPSPHPHPPTSPPTTTTTTTRTPTRTSRTRTTSPSSRSPATPPGVVVLSDAEWTQHEQHVHGVRYESPRRHSRTGEQPSRQRS